MNAPKPRSTIQRKAIVAAIDNVDAFISAQDLHTALLKEGRKIGLATVYRTLSSLAEEGYLDTLQEGTETLYRSCDNHHHHHHLICRTCGKTVEITGEGIIEEWAKQTALANGFSDVEHVLELIGYCAECATEHQKTSRANAEHIGAKM